MKDFLSEYVGKLIRTLAICTMIIVLPLIFNGQLMLIGALLVGYLFIVLGKVPALMQLAPKSKCFGDLR